MPQSAQQDYKNSEIQEGFSPSEDEAKAIKQAIDLGIIFDVILVLQAIGPRPISARVLSVEDLGPGDDFSLIFAYFVEGSPILGTLTTLN